MAAAQSPWSIRVSRERVSRRTPSLYPSIQPSAALIRVNFASTATFGWSPTNHRHRTPNMRFLAFCLLALASTAYGRVLSEKRELSELPATISCPPGSVLFSAAIVDARYACSPAYCEQTVTPHDQTQHNQIGLLQSHTMFAYCNNPGNRPQHWPQRADITPAQTSFMPPSGPFRQLPWRPRRRCWPAELLSGEKGGGGNVPTHMLPNCRQTVLRRPGRGTSML